MGKEVVISRFLRVALANASWLLSYGVGGVSGDREAVFLVLVPGVLRACGYPLEQGELNWAVQQHGRAVIEEVLREHVVWVPRSSA